MRIYAEVRVCEEPKLECNTTENRLDFLSQCDREEDAWYNRWKVQKNKPNGGGAMSENPNGVAQLAEEFEDCRRILLALGDENRQHLILEMMRMDQCGGVRVGAITERSHLSRPAVSHHVRILKDAGLLNVRREGTKNYYYFDADTQAMDRLIRMLLHAKAIMEQLPDRSGDQY